MPDGKQARLDVIDETLGSDETVIHDELALLFDPGGGLKKREAEGYLVLTNRRLVFGTAKHGILVDLPIAEIKVPVSITFKFTMARLAIETTAGTKHTLVMNKRAARAIALTIEREVSP